MKQTIAFLFVALNTAAVCTFAHAESANSAKSNDQRLNSWVYELDENFNQFSSREGRVTGQVNTEEGKLCEEERDSLDQLDQCLRKTSKKYSDEADRSYQNFKNSRSGFKIEGKDLGRGYSDESLIQVLRNYQTYETLQDSMKKEKHSFMTYQEDLIGLKRSSVEQSICQTSSAPSSPSKASESWIKAKCYIPIGMTVAESCDSVKSTSSQHYNECLSKGRQLIKDHVDNAIAASASAKLEKLLPKWEEKYYGKTSAPEQTAQSSQVKKEAVPVVKKKVAAKKTKEEVDENRYRLFHQTISGSAFSIRSSAAYKSCNIGQAITDKNCVDCKEKFKEAESDLSASEFEKLQNRPKWGSNFLDLLRFEAIQNRFKSYRLFGGTDFPIPKSGKVGQLCRDSAADFIAKLQSKAESAEDLEFKKSRTSPERMVELVNAAALLKANADRLTKLKEIPKKNCETVETYDPAYPAGTLSTEVCSPNPAYENLVKEGAFDQLSIAILEILSQFPELAIDRFKSSAMDQQHIAADQVLKLAGQDSKLADFTRAQNEKIKASAAKDLQDVCTPGKVSDEELLADDALFEQTLKNHPEYRPFALCAKKIGDAAVTAASGGTSRNVRDFGCMGVAALFDYASLVSMPMPLLAGGMAIAGTATGTTCLVLGLDDKEKDYKRRSKALAYLDGCLKRGGGSDCSHKEYLSRQESLKEAQKEFEDSLSATGLATTTVEALLTGVGAGLTFKNLWKGYKALSTGRKAALYVSELSELQNARKAALASGDKLKVKSIEESMQAITHKVKNGQGAPTAEEIKAAWGNLQKEYVAGRYQALKDLDEAQIAARAEGEIGAEKIIAQNAKANGGKATAYVPPEMTPKQINATVKKHAAFFKKFEGLTEAKKSSLARSIKTLETHGLTDAEVRTFLNQNGKYMAGFAGQEEYATEIAYLVKKRAALEGVDEVALLDREFKRACKLGGCKIKGLSGEFKEPKNFDFVTNDQKYAEYRCSRPSHN